MPRLQGQRVIGAIRGYEDTAPPQPLWDTMARDGRLSCCAANGAGRGATSFESEEDERNPSRGSPVDERTFVGADEEPEHDPPQEREEGEAPHGDPVLRHREAPEKRGPRLRLPHTCAPRVGSHAAASRGRFPGVFRHLAASSLMAHRLNHDVLLERPTSTQAGEYRGRAGRAFYSRNSGSVCVTCT